MPSLLTTSDKNAFIENYIDFFDTFKERIVVWKNPKKVFSNVNLSAIFGYGDNSNTANFTYIPVSGIYSGVVNYESEQMESTIGEANEKLSAGEIFIEVSGDAKDFINDGTTPFIQIGNEKFTLISEDRDRNFLGYKFYSYKLKKSN